MTLFSFQPRRLQRAAEQLIQAHPFTVQDLTRPDLIQQRFPNLLKDLRQRLDATPEPQLAAFAQALSPLERPLIPLLHLDTAEPIRDKALRLLDADRNLADLDALLRAFTRFAATPREGHTLARTVLQRFPPPHALRPEWRLLLQHRADAQADTFPRQALLDLSRQSIALTDLLQRLQIPPDSNLGAALERGVLDAGPTAWAAQGHPAALRAFQRADLPRRLNALLAAYNERAGRGPTLQAALLLAQASLTPLQDDNLLAQRLQQDHPAVWTWLQELHLQAFFLLDGGHHGKERFEFWRRYLGNVKDLHINAKAGRLFMNFGEIGIIEFLQTGNAVYAYNIELFNQLKNLDIKRPNLDASGSVLHSTFKQRENSIAWWTHSGDWPSKFKRKLDKLNIYPASS